MTVSGANSTNRAFTLIELLVVIAVIGILASLLLPSLSRANSSAKRSKCLSNVRQINVALQLYADEHDDKIDYYTNTVYYAYKDCILSYLALSENTSARSSIFACPSDPSFNALELTHYSSYGFNGVARGTNEFGMAGRRFATVRDPAKTALCGEISGGIGVSWHVPSPAGQYRNAPNVGGFVDGHAAYVKIYWNGVKGIPDFPFYYEPPVGYAYKWTGN